MSVGSKEATLFSLYKIGMWECFLLERYTTVWDLQQQCVAELPVASITKYTVGSTETGDTDGVSFDDERSSKRSADAFYPGTGHAERVGGEDVDAARGTNINIPWPTHHFGDIEYLQVLTELVIPVAQEFAPEVVIISCGFDSAQGDLLGSMNLTPSGYYLMTKLLCKHFSKVVVVLEGGYHVANVTKCSETVLRALLEVSAEAAAQPLPFTRMLYAQTQRLVARVKHQHLEYWRCYRSDSQ